MESTENTQSPTPKKEQGPIFDLAFLSRHFRKILVIVILGMSYIQLRYECEEHLVNIARLKDENNTVRYTGIATWGKLTQKNRPEYIRERITTGSVDLIESDEPPVKIK